MQHDRMCMHEGRAVRTMLASGRSKSMRLNSMRSLMVLPPLSQTVQSINSDLHNECLRAATRMSMWREQFESQRLGVGVQFKHLPHEF